MVNLITALLAGLTSFISPCVLPLVPAYISFISGVSVEDLVETDRKHRGTQKIALKSLIFILGFSLIFILLGASATFIGKFLLSQLHFFTKVGGVIIVIFGLHLTGIFKIRFLNYEKRFHTRGNQLGVVGIFGLGIAFAFGWSPCIGPILAAILALASTQETVLQGVLLLSFYSLGLAIPFFLTGLATSSLLRFFSSLKRHFRTVEIISGLFLVLIGVMIFFNLFSILSNLLIQWFPGLGNIG
ncbi:cytochrome c biogenesis protein CcdA [candidate division KSB1 bacterium]|nr:cytochrome c biogenesis protein CcdA [bacterium]OQX58055.1 MAG: cytochrome C biogenesis protein [candidate division KSB1 bacterium 4484_219]RKY77930.1 MAG: cytochrome c biogenesis protein CcdA [candidate division KSB1 bacterium]HDI51020.1 cytochrome c biogenesis protein CcdA [Bacteroidota bacterium]RKY80987.1 MAG: cytochrome c biogenesis protein CcdA [candidate division KSB1 bacterium]